MCERLPLDKNSDADTFCSFYRLKEELVDFCRANNLPACGGKINTAHRITAFLRTGEIVCPKPASKRDAASDTIAEDTQIEPSFICSEMLRAFSKAAMGETGSSNIAFQKWLKANAGKTHKQAIACWRYKKLLKRHNAYEKTSLIAPNALYTQ